MSESEWRRQIEREEYLRHQARREIERREAAQERQIEETYERDIAYIEEHGRMGAAIFTLFKWATTGLVLSVVFFFFSSSPLVETLGDCVALFVIFCIIGVWRGAKYATFNL